MKQVEIGNYVISVGYEGPTDACLILTYKPTGRRKEFLIESLPWAVLSVLKHNGHRERYLCETIMYNDTTQDERNKPI